METDHKKRLFPILNWKLWLSKCMWSFYSRFLYRLYTTIYPHIPSVNTRFHAIVGEPQIHRSIYSKVWKHKERSTYINYIFVVLSIVSWSEYHRLHSLQWLIWKDHAYVVWFSRALLASFFKNIDTPHDKHSHCQVYLGTLPLSKSVMFHRKKIVQ